MEKFIKNQFGFKSVQIKQLGGYDNKNFLVIGDGKKYIFKTYNTNDISPELLEAENNIQNELNKMDSGAFAQPVNFKSGVSVETHNVESRKVYCRMLTYSTGLFLDEVEHTEELFKSLGKFLAETDSKLRGLHNLTIIAKEWPWDVQYLSMNKAYLSDIENPKDRRTVSYFFQQYEQNVQPVAHKLRKALIHNDANEQNVLTTEGLVSGIIDFGDLAYTYQINEPAVAIAYACMDKEEPLKWASYIISAYNTVIQLEKIETDVLYYLIAARLVISVCNSAHSEKLNPGNKHVLVSQNQAWRMLYQWLEINPEKAAKAFA